jgi:hypothetical protein
MLPLRTRLACANSASTHAKQNRPWTMNFGSRLLGCPTFQNRLSEKPHSVKARMNALAKAK